MAEVWRWWPQSVQETLEFETDVRMARSAEWRDSLKDATQFFTLSHILPVAQAEAMIETVRANGIGEWLVPEWPNATIAAASLSLAATVLPVAVPAAYVVGQAVFIGVGPEAWEQGEVASVGVSDITLAAGLGAAYTGSASRPLVMAPLVRCIAPGGVDFQSTFSAQGLSARFMALDPKDLAANPYPTHSSLPVVTDGRVPFQPLAGGLNQAADLFSSGFGAYSLQQAETYPRRRGTISWYDKGHSDRWTRRSFLHQLRGRDGAFWLPTGQRDLPLAAAIDSADLTITVAPCASNADMVGRRIVIKEGSNLVIREVAAAADDGDNQELSIASTGVDFTSSAIVSLGIKSRLDSDQVEISYQFAAGGLAAFCAVPVIEVP
jgi:hypothetical protein